MTLSPLDLAIVGAPRCGTTTLYVALCMHPDLQGTTPKETFYFCDEFTIPGMEGRNFKSGGWGGFEAYFIGERNGRRRLEATSINLFQKTAMAAFGALSPQPLVLVTLRCPAEQIRSEFYYHRSYGRIVADVNFATYARALLEDDSSYFRNAVPDRHVRGVLESSILRNRYVEWLDLWSRYVPVNQLFITTLHELSQNTLGLLTNLATRLDLDPRPFADIGTKELHQNPTSIGHVRQPGRLARVGRRVIPHGPMRRRIAEWHRARRMGALLEASSDPAEDEILERLGRHFEPYNRELAARYSVDTSRWHPFGLGPPKA